MGMRIGSGVDVHRFGADRPLVLAGVEVPHHTGLVGHSDADVAAHALCDALLAAAGLPDIGHHFPPGEPEWEGASGARLLALVMDELSAKSLAVINAHLVVLCEQPKIGPHRDAMQETLGAIVGAPVSVHATTTEGLGFTGREEGIMCQAVALVEGS
ncbi:MAG: 2-C-methyl-D-erythritol 2,4-cyclodiphosphate synthase [Thermoleophilia bacterium]|nr:2-C-methyl-D-erythritol 2,4-cyclodiphosphate synthase [Thermoleophilia bacterium]MDH3724400.1 2-C-methyl-D-erythritol 2,4-cyclodiphosphate synthase [Thermoleophilia bacterium]